MEHSMNSIMEKARSSSESEESSWTMYLEDFLTSSHHHDDQHHSSSFSSGYENSIVSDAASSFSNLGNNCNEEVLGFSNRSSSPSCIIKRKAKKALLHDDALEDTATSPANSPKVSTRDGSNYFSSFMHLSHLSIFKIFINFSCCCFSLGL